ncbi:MAG: nucleotide-binding domain-containing protein, partial [bacterium]
QLEGVLNTANAAVAAPTTEKTIELWRSVFDDAYPESLGDSGVRIDKAEAPRLYRYNARISAQIAAPNSDNYSEGYPSNGRKLPKHWSLKFRLDQTSVPEPYTIKWAVHNHGAEARQAGQLYHETVGAKSHIETTLYRGHHFLDCEVLKDDLVVAKARHIVNVR